MSKRIVGVLLAAILLLVITPNTYADAVFGNEFFYENEDNVEQLGERYYGGKKFVVNSPAGYVIPKVEPGSEQGVSTAYSYMGMNPGGGEDKPYTFSDVVFIFLNGEVIEITHTFLHDGKHWGIMSLSHTYQPPGWIPMDELLVQYALGDFDRENKDSFYTYTGSYDTILSANKLVLWQWPGSDMEKRIIDCNYEDFDIEGISAAYAYKDQQDRVWCYVNLNYSYKSPTSPYIDDRPYYIDRYDSGWICLSDSENSKIPSFNPAPKPVKWSPDGTYDWSDNATVWPPADLSELPPANTTVLPTVDLTELSSANTTVLPPADSSELSKLEPETTAAEATAANVSLPAISDTPGPLSAVIAIIIVSAVVVVSVILILLFRKSKKASKKA